jgi:hypothetical protein
MCTMTLFSLWKEGEKSLRVLTFGFWLFGLVFRNEHWGRSNDDHSSSILCFYFIGNKTTYLSCKIPVITTKSPLFHSPLSLSLLAIYCYWTCSSYLQRVCLLDTTTTTTTTTELIQFFFHTTRRLQFYHLRFFLSYPRLDLARLGLCNNNLKKLKTKQNQHQPTT